MFASLFEQLTRHQIVHVIVVTAVAALVWWSIARWLRRSNRIRRRNILRRKSFEAVPTASPIDDPVEVAKQRGLESIEQQFTVIRRITFPLLLALTSVLLIIPFLERVPAGLLSLTVGATTVLVGIAAKPVIENAIAGLALAVSKTVNIGDTVTVDELYGTVEDISLTHTTIKLWDWRRYVVPNSTMSQLKILNYSLVDRQKWACVEFWISYDADLEEVERIAVEAARSRPSFSGSETPAFWIMDMAKEGLRCWVAAWADTPSAGWMLKHETRLELVRVFKERGITSHVHRIQTPHRAVLPA